MGRVSAPQDVLRRMIAEASEDAPGWISPSREAVLSRISLHDLAPLLAQHLADALDLLGCPNTTTIPCKPGGCKVHDLLASVERDLARPETLA